jgi:hypothetical protein
VWIFVVQIAYRFWRNTGRISGGFPTDFLQKKLSRFREGVTKAGENQAGGLPSVAECQQMKL